MINERRICGSSLKLSGAIHYAISSLPYGFQIHWSEEDGAYIVTCPAFPGLSAFGDTPEGGNA